MTPPPGLVSAPEADRDVEEAFAWYEQVRAKLGIEFLTELREAYRRILANPDSYQLLSSGIRRALLRRFPYAVFFVIRSEDILILAVLHVARDPRRWQERA